MGRMLDVDIRSRILTIRTREGQEKKYRVPENTPLMRDGRKGEIQDLQKGDQIMLGVNSSEQNGEPPKVLRVMGRSDR